MDAVIYRYAGIIGLNPDPFTLRQLVWMAEGRGTFEWAQTANIMALHINMNRKKGAKPVDPNDLNPFTRKNKKKNILKLSPKDSMEALRLAFCKTQTVNHHHAQHEPCNR